MAADYISTSVPVFHKIAAEYGIRPLFPNRRENIYDRHQLDDLLDRLSGRTEHHGSPGKTHEEAVAEALRKLDARDNAIRNCKTK